MKAVLILAFSFVAQAQNACCKEAVCSFDPFCCQQFWDMQCSLEEKEACGHCQTHCEPEYDYIIVGSGPAGSAVANVLSEDPKNRVLLVEEGGYARYPDKGVQDIWIGSKWFGLIFNKEIEKAYYTVPQPGLFNRSDWAPRAKVVGGCGAHNALVFVKGSNEAYDKWGEAAPGWSWADLKPEWEHILSVFPHTVSSPTQVDPPPNVDELMAICVEAGHDFNADFNQPDDNHMGCNYRQHAGVIENDEQGKRFFKRTSPYDVFVQSVVQQRSNLMVRTDTRADKILFEGTRAVGVTTQNPFTGDEITFRATKEVILSAGVYDTPKLLMLSGVGPKDHLDSLGIPVVKDLPGVGSHLVDDSFCELIGPELAQQPTDGVLPESIWPIGGIQLWGSEDGNVPATFNLNIGVGNYGAQVRAHITVAMEPLDRASEGTVRLASANPADKPLIDPKYFSDPQDMVEYVELFKRGVQLWKTDAARAILIGDSVWPGPDVDTDEEIQEWIRTYCGGTDFHPAGTSRMGLDPTTDVVDHHARVHGLTGLRVLDSSIFPVLTRGNPHSPSMLVGLHGARIILADHA